MTLSCLDPARRALLACLLLVACGGGVETGGTGATGSSYVEGPVTGFGSVIVAGIRFDESSARVEDADGNLRDRSELRLGMRLEVEGGAIADDSDGGRSATATRVRIVADLLGPITAIDASGQLIAVLGQAVRLSAATVIDGAAGGLASLAVGNVVEVHGFVEPTSLADSYVATRVERRSAAPTTYHVRGLVRNLDATARTLRIGGQVFDLAATGVPAGLADGQIVRLALQTAQVSGRWPVTAITVESRALPTRDDAEVEGLVTAITSSSRFSIDGITVDASGATFPGGSAGLVTGARVKVRGRSANGELVATQVDVRSDQDAFNDGIDVRDVIASLDTTAQTFSVRGVTVFYGSVPAPRFDNGTAADLANGKRVRVRGTLSADRTRAVATRIEFVNP
jgi:hypothetical protein